MDNTRVVLVVILVGLSILIVAKWSVNHFRILGNPYRMEEGGSRSETQDECLVGSTSYTFCMMTDGTPGMCMLSGQCVPDIMQDLRTVRDELNLPYCTKPVYKTGCRRYCKCRNMAKGRADYIANVDQCTNECEQWYSPL